MTFKIGSITLPHDPSRAMFKFRKEMKKISLLRQLPFLLSMGPQVPVLKLKGFIAAPGKTSSQLETDYLIPLRDMIWKPAAFPRRIVDDGQVADNFWSVGESGSGVIGSPVLSDDTSIVKKGANSCKINVPSGTAADWLMNHLYAPALNLSKQDFLTMWWYGANTGKTLELRFFTGAAYFYYQWTEDWTAWARKFVRKDQFSESGSPNWASIDKVELYMYAAAVAVHYLDRTVVGVGQLVDGPGIRYDGIHIVRDFTWVEEYRQLNAFPYELELWLEDDYY